MPLVMHFMLKFRYFELFNKYRGLDGIKPPVDADAHRIVFVDALAVDT